MNHPKDKINFPQAIVQRKTNQTKINNNPYANFPNQIPIYVSNPHHANYQHAPSHPTPNNYSNQYPKPFNSHNSPSSHYHQPTSNPSSQPPTPFNSLSTPTGHYYLPSNRQNPIQHRSPFSQHYTPLNPLIIYVKHFLLFHLLFFDIEGGTTTILLSW